MFSLCEYYLVNSDCGKTIERRKEWLINKILEFGGFVGVLAVYAAMVMRPQTLRMTRLRDTIVLDLKESFILGRPEAAPHRSELLLRRFHLPSISIAKELWSAYQRYQHHRRHLTAGPTNPASCRWYLYWMVHFYIHRSIIMANQQTVLAGIRQVVTVEEFTPYFAGCISAFRDLGLPVTLYYPFKLAFPDLTLQAAPLFAKLVVGNGTDADLLLSKREDLPISVENWSNRSKSFDSKQPPNLALFLSSYYHTSDSDLETLMESTVLPFLNGVVRSWRPSSFKLFCHPQDPRPARLLSGHDFQIHPPDQKRDRSMRGFDIVISGNSSVVGEALDEGIPVVYTGGLDFYEYDYLGYVARGLVLDATESLPSKLEVERFYSSEPLRQRFDSFKRGSGQTKLVEFTELF